MFQYATGRALAWKTGTQLLADSRAFRDYPLHKYLIDRFETQMTEASAENMGQFRLPPESQSGLSKAFWKLANRGRLTYFRERGLEYDPRFAELGDNTYLRGYWQSEKYFHEIADPLRRELTRSEPISDANRELLDQIDQTTAVSLHIRRGDYVSDAKTQRIHGTCSLDYYAEATRYLAERLATKPTFFIFSDDPQWTRDNLKLGFPMRFVSHNAVDDPWPDMQLMSACQHHVIANSSFSWWGAWLNPSPNKIVVACRRWFADAGKNDKDLVPETWVRLGPE